jgi:hypothetical protein
MSADEDAPATELVPTEPSGARNLAPALVITRSVFSRGCDWLTSWGTGPSIFSLGAFLMSMAFVVVGNLLLYTPRGHELSDEDVFWQYFLPPAAIMFVYGVVYVIFAQSHKFKRGAVSARFVLSFVCWCLGFSLLFARWYSHHGYFSEGFGVLCTWANLALMAIFAIGYGAYVDHQQYDMHQAGARRICWGRGTINLLTLFALFDFSNGIWEVLNLQLTSVWGSMITFCVACFACFICQWGFTSAVSAVDDSGVPAG